METRVGALRLAGAVIAAAGTGGIPAGSAPRPAEAPLGAVVTASLSYRSRAGRPPRLVETAAGAVYVPGAAQTGVRQALRRQARGWADSPFPVVVSLVGDSAGSLAAAATELEGVRGVAAIEVNLAAFEEASGAPFGHDPAVAAQSVRAVRRACALPVWAKLAVDLSDAPGTLAALAAAGAAASTIGGGVPAAGPAGNAGYPGYLVGPATFPIVLALVQRLAAEAPLPIVACGGVVSAVEARAYLRAGAVAVQVGSAHLANPGAAQDVASALATGT